mgnify:CR=1 FL=1
MYPKREAFRTPPVVVVAAEARFTDSPRLRQKETLDAIAIALEARFTFSEPLTGVDVQAVAPGMPAQLAPRQGILLRNAERTQALTLTATALTYETTDYTEFEVLHAAMGAASQALVDAQVAPELKRVGLRYIDEIRVARPVTDARAWRTWIDASLLGPMGITPDHVPSAGIQGAVGQVAGPVLLPVGPADDQVVPAGTGEEREVRVRGVQHPVRVRVGRSGPPGVEGHHVEEHARRVLAGDRARHQVALLDHTVLLPEQGNKLVRVV